MNIIGNTLDELYRAFDILNKEFYDNELPYPIITIQKGRANNLGWFTLGKVWKNSSNEEQQAYEINITANNLNREPIDIIGTLLHEMVHYYHALNDIKDATNNVHNKKFKNEAERVGFIVTKGSPNGWGYTECGEDLKDFILTEINPNAECFLYFRNNCVLKDKEKGEGDGTEKKPRKKNTFKYTCPCCGLEIKAKSDVNVLCGDCNVSMEIEEE